MTRLVSARIGAAVAAVAVVGAGVVALPASEAAPAVGAIGPVKVINGPGSVPASTPAHAPGVAVLPNGATTVAWISHAGAKLHVRSRGANSSSWGAIRTLTLPAGWTVDPGSFFGGRIDLAPLGNSRFLLVWREHSASGYRIRAARLTLSSAISPETLSNNAVDGPDSDFLSVAVNSAGRAVVTWTAFAPDRGRFVVLPSPTASWGAPATIAAGTSIGIRAAVSAGGSVCFAWYKPGVAPAIYLMARCRTASSAALRPVTNLGLTASIGPPLFFALTAVGEKFIVANERAESGAAPVLGPLTPVSLRILELNGASSSTWNQKAVFRQPNQVLVGPMFGVSSDGWVAMAFSRIQEGISGGTLGVTDYVATRSPSGTWSTATPIAATAGGGVVGYYGYIHRVAVGPGGSVVVTTAQASSSSVSGWVVAAAVRPSASAALRPLQRLGGGAIVADVAVAPSGQATFVTRGKTGSDYQIAVQTTALAGGAS